MVPPSAMRSPPVEPMRCTACCSACCVGNGKCSIGSKEQAVAALRTGDGLRPLDWYHEHVLRGALAAGLPGDYVERLRAVPTRVDPDASRQRRELLIYGV